jgi:hypothetical protein
MNTKKLAGIIVACTVAIILVIVIVIPPLIQTPTTPNQPPAPPPTITILEDQTLIVRIGPENQRTFYFNLDKYGVVRGTIEVVKGESIDYFLYEESAEAGWTEAKGIRVVQSSFEVQLDPGWYYLIVRASRWDPADTDEERTVSIYLEFES